MNIVVGAGIKGILAAKNLATKGSVSLLDKSEKVGGILNGLTWKEYQMDLGCQIFDNSHTQTTQALLDLAQNQYRPQHMKHGSLLNEHFSEDYAVLDLSLALQDKQNIYHELLAVEKEPKAVENLSDYFLNRFGKSAGELLIRAAEKKLHARLDELDPCASRVTLLDRIKLFDDATTLNYKNTSNFLDNRLAHYNPKNPTQYYTDTDFAFRNFYPSKHKGLKQFVQNCHSHLENKGVNLCLGVELESLSSEQITYVNLSTQDKIKLGFDKLFWAGDLLALEQLTFSTQQFQSLIFSMPMVLVYFEVSTQQATNYDYVHNYNHTDFIFRASNMGRYTEQIDNGKTFVCCEIPTLVDSKIWQKTEDFLPKIWQECINMNICREGNYIDYKVIKAPATYKIPKKGFQKYLQEFRAELKRAYPKIELIDPVATSFADILSATNID